MQNSNSFTSLMLVLGLAFIVPLLLLRFRNLRLPVVVGEIMAGIVIGRSGFGLVREGDPVLVLLAELGFVFLMFLAGMEIDFTSLRFSRPQKNGGSRQSWGPLQLGSINFTLTLLISTAIAFSLYFADMVQNAWIIALILSTTSLGVVMPVLKENNLISGVYGQTIMVTAMIADFATMLLITVLVTTLSNVQNYEILLIGLLFVAFFLMYHFGMLFFNRIPGLRLAMRELSHASTQIKVRAAFTIMLIFVAFSEVLGAEMILGAFLAGAVMSLVRTPDDASLGYKLEAIGFGFFIPIFFIMVGVNFDIAALVSSTRAVLMVPILLVAAILVKIVPSVIFRLRFSRRDCLAAGSLLTARLSLIIAASAIGLRLGLIDDSINSAIILVASISVIAAPLLFSRLSPKEELGESPIVIASTGEMGFQVAEKLKAHGVPTVIIDSDAENVETAHRRGLEAAQADLTREDPRAEPFLEGARAVICTSSNMEYDYKVCRLVRGIYGIEHVVVQVSDLSYKTLFEKMGVHTMNPAMDRISLLALAGRNPSLYELVTRTDDDKEVVEVVMRNAQFTNQPLRNLRLPKDVLVLALRRRGELLLPQGDTQLSIGDQLTLIGPLKSIKDARLIFSG